MSALVSAADGEKIDADAAAINATDAAALHVPEPPAVPVVEVIPDPPVTPTDGDAALDELRQTLATMGETLAGVVGTVATLMENATANIAPDDSPAKLPWTHRGGKSE